MKNKAFIVIGALVLATAFLFVGSAKNTGAYGSCVVNTFFATPNNVVSGGTAILTINTSGCQNLVLSGGTYSNYSIGSQTSFSVGPLYSNTTYTLSGNDGYGNRTDASTTINIGSTGNCAITSFYASPTNITAGGTSTLAWNTSGCTNVSVTGPGVNSSSTSNTLPLGALYNTGVYQITASSYNNTVTQNLTITVGGVSQTNVPVASTATATNITLNGAQLNGSISSSNCGYYCGSTNTYYFLYGTNQYSLNSQTPSQTAPYGSGQVTAQVYNLTPNTTYYFQLVAANSYGTNSGSILSFFTNSNIITPPYNNYGYVNAVTSVATNVSGTSARLNGVASSAQYGATTYFEYGTSASLGNQTSPQSVLPGTVNNYYDTISVSPNATYYYRIVGVVGGQTFRGDIVSFYTGATTYIPPVVVDTNYYPVYTTPTYTSGVGGGTAYASISITTQSQYISAGNSVQYTVNYQNLSGQILSGAILNVILPKGLVFNNSTQGVYTTDNTVAANIGTLQPGANGTITIMATADSSFVMSNNFVATATLAFTLPNRAQDSAIAYSINNYNQNQQGYNNSLAGLALFGGGFFPNSLVGWIVLILIIIALVMIVRYFYHSANKHQLASMPNEKHVYYTNNQPHTPPTDKYGDPMYH